MPRVLATDPHTQSCCMHIITIAATCAIFRTEVRVGAVRPFSSMSGKARLTASPASRVGVTWGSHSLRVRLRRVLPRMVAAPRTLSLMSSEARSVMVQMSPSLSFSSGHLLPCSRSDRALQLASLLRHNLPPISCMGTHTFTCKPQSSGVVNRMTCTRQYLEQFLQDSTKVLVHSLLGLWHQCPPDVRHGVPDACIGVILVPVQLRHQVGDVGPQVLSC